MSSQKKHNKIKNTGILFELLTRQIAVDVMNDSKNSPAIKIIKEFFNEKTTLGREKELYSILIEKKYKTAEQANILLEAVIKNRRKLSNRRLKNEKYNLIKRIKENYSVNDFFNSRIPNYKVLASIYNVFELESSKEKIGPIEETDSKISIVENICGQSIKQSKKSKDLVESYQSQEQDVRLLTYQLLVDKFNKKYSNLNESQKNLLREYINNLSNTNSLREFIDTEVIKVQKALKSHLRIVDDKITKIKLAEAIEHTSTAIGGKLVKDSHVVSLMRYYELIKELDNVHEDK
jgi:hypothetical protein|tara:strand:+ start:577 stop:1452 length:876 start_codon:yes stop_codon:yes gene_type:complete